MTSRSYHSIIAKCAYLFSQSSLDGAWGSQPASQSVSHSISVDCAFIIMHSRERYRISWWILRYRLRAPEHHKRQQNLNCRNGKKGKHSVALIWMREHMIYFSNVECDGALFIVSFFFRSVLLLWFEIPITIDIDKFFMMICLLLLFDSGIWLRFWRNSWWGCEPSRLG